MTRSNTVDPLPIIVDPRRPPHNTQWLLVRRLAMPVPLLARRGAQVGTAARVARGLPGLSQPGCATSACSYD